MSTLRIKDAPLLPNVDGSEKIPTGGKGDYAVSVDQITEFARGGIPQQLENHINDKENPHDVTKEQVGLGNVDNTSDINKPVSTATQQALDLKANQSATYTKTEVDGSLSLKADKSYVDSKDLLKADKTYVDTALSSLSTQASKFYPTLTVANADIANIAINQPVQVGESGVNGGLWYKATAGATSLTRSAFDPLTQAKTYTDAKIIDRDHLDFNYSYVGELDVGTDLNIKMKEGTYLSLGALVNAPAGIGVNVLFSNQSFSGRYVQTIYNITDPSKSWKRVIWFNTLGALISAEPWKAIKNAENIPRADLADAFLYVGVLTSSDNLNAVTTKDGTYVATSTPSNAPAGETGQAIVKVEKQGAFTVQTYQRLNDSRYVWKRTIQAGQTPEAWRDLSLINFSASRSNLADSFLYAGVLTSSNDLNTTQKDGTYVATSAPINAPVGAPAIAFITVSKAGAMVRQIYTDVHDASISWSRNFQNLVGGTIVTQGWKKGSLEVATTSKVGGIKVGAGLLVAEDGTLSVTVPTQQNPFAGKKLVCFGDSVTEFKDYPDQIRNILGLAEAYNVGFGGCQMSAHSAIDYREMCMYRLAEYIATGDYTGLISAANDLYARTGDDNRAIAARLAAIDWNTVDYITIFYGTNDWGNKPGSLGTVAEKTPDGSTFLGSANYVVDRLQTAYPHLKIMFLSPIYRTRLVSGDNKNSDDYPNYSGEYMYQYVEGLQAVAKKNHVLCVDMYNESGINKYTAGLYLNPYPDGLHLSDAGATLIAQKVAAKLRSNF